MRVKPKIAITLGDPAGIGPEITFKALRDPDVRNCCEPVVFGDMRLLKAFGRPRCSSFVDIPLKGLERIVPGRTSKLAGLAAYEAVIAAAGSCRAGRTNALVTAPISKEAIKLAGVKFPGHTELLADLCGVRDFAMLMVAGRLRSVMVTRHVAVSKAGAELSKKEIVRTVKLLNGSLKKDFGLRGPKIAVCSLNPHAGENGLIGREEIVKINPAVKKLVELGIRAEGPLPPDSAWMKHVSGEYDLVVTMTHDHTMIPLKVLSPKRIVNVTIGLPFARTSPGHGTGFDIAGKDIADPRPMIEAVKLAALLALRAEKKRRSRT